MNSPSRAMSASTDHSTDGDVLNGLTTDHREVLLRSSRARTRLDRLRDTISGRSV